MPAYIIDTEKFEVTQTYKDSSYASYDMSDNYGWEPNNRYIMLHDEDAAYEYWHTRGEESGEFYEGLGYSENMKHDMFKDWLNG